MNDKDVMNKNDISLINKASFMIAKNVAITENVYYHIMS